MSQGQETRTADRNALVWLLGNGHPAADRSIGWHEQLPNPGEPDVLIDDTTMLSEQVMRKIGTAEIAQARSAIEDKLHAGNATTIVITRHMLLAPPTYGGRPLPYSPPDYTLTGYGAYSDYKILPVLLRTVPVPTGSRMIADEGHDFKAYLSAIGHFAFYIKGWRPRVPHYGGASPRFGRANGQSVRDNSGHDLGFTLVAGVMADGSLAHPESPGRLVFLPPPTGPEGDPIGKILSVYGKSVPGREAPPAWAEGLSFARACELRRDISKLRSDVDNTLGKIDDLERLRAPNGACKTASMRACPSYGNRQGASADSSCGENTKPSATIAAMFNHQPDAAAKKRPRCTLSGEPRASRTRTFDGGRGVSQGCEWGDGR